MPHDPILAELASLGREIDAEPYRIGCLRHRNSLPKVSAGGKLYGRAAARKMVNGMLGEVLEEGGFSGRVARLMECADAALHPDFEVLAANL